MPAAAAEAGSELCLEAVWFRPGPAGARGCGVWAFRLGSVYVSWGARSVGLGESLQLDWHRVLRFVIARGGGRGRVRPVTRCSGVTGVTCREPTPQIVADVSPWWGGRASIGALELRPSGARQWPVGRGGRPTAQPRPSRRKKRRHEHEARIITPPPPPDPPPFEAEQRNHPRCRHLPDRIMSRRDRDARFRSGYLGSVGDAGGTVTPHNS